MTDLFAATREHDLPPRWDGAAVEWGEWRDAPVVTICPPPKPIPKRDRCCDSPCLPLMAHGYVHDAELGRPVLALTAFRCECGQDTVVDDDGEVWTLDPTDYQPEGSTAP